MNASSSSPGPVIDAPTSSPSGFDDGFDPQRRFGGLARLYGEGAPRRMAQAHVAVVGLGGVGSWTAEALARTGVGALTLIDLDVVSESNINRQLHALGQTVGQSKIDAMAARIMDINPACVLTLVDDFVTPDNVAAHLSGQYSVILDCADQASAKIAMILHARSHRTPVVVCGGAGGKTDPLALRGGDLSQACHDALLAKLRNTLRREHGFARPSGKGGKSRTPRMHVQALWLDQPVRLPDAWQRQAHQAGHQEGDRAGHQEGDQAAHQEGDQAGHQDATPGQQAERVLAGAALACAGYGSIVTVTAAMGMAAAHLAVERILQTP